MSEDKTIAVLESVNINRIDWGDSKGLYEGSVQFNNQLGNIKLKLTPELSTALLAVIAKELIHTSQTVANQLNEAIVTSTKLLPKK